MEPNFFNTDQSHMRSSSIFSPATPAGSAIPPAIRVRLYELFLQIEKEFETLYTENVGLQERIDWLSNEHQKHKQMKRHLVTENFQDITSSAGGTAPSVTSTPSSTPVTSVMNTVMSANFPKAMSKGIYAHKIRSHTNRLRQQTNKIMSNFKGPPSLNCCLRKRYLGHKDGIWEVSVSKFGPMVLGTASADHTVIVWSVDSAKPLLQYTGHGGSVNSVRFHPTRELVITSSGDGTAHIWQCAADLFSEGRVMEVVPRSTPDVDLSQDQVFNETSEDNLILRTPLRSLTGHTGVVIAADWLPGGDQAVTAGWDRQACVWDTNTGQLLHQLMGHDEELTNTTTHPVSRLVVTSSKDSTFRLWDFREAIHSVSVFQGHQDTVTSAVFTKDDQVVSGSDDRTVRIWDLRNMRSPLATVHTDSPVNRLSVSNSGYIAIPLDNRNVRLYDLGGQRLGRLSRSSRQGHARMVCCSAWTPDDTTPNLFTCGFDKMTLGWSVVPREKELDANSATCSTANQKIDDIGAKLSLGIKGSS